MIAVDRLLSDGRSVHVRLTDRRDGDLCVDLERSVLDVRRAAIVDRPWMWARQVHGRDVIDVADDADLDALVGREADVLITRRADVALAAHGADCATIALWNDAGTVAAVHAGWRGLLDGAIGAAVDRLRGDGGPVHAVVGPTIGPECYEFGGSDLDTMRRRFGDAVVSHTADGSPALDVRAAFDVIAAENGLDVVERDASCTACAADRLWSHRARGDAQRQALVIWISES